MDISTALIYFGLPTLFIMFCMIVTGWASSAKNLKFVRKLSRWATLWGGVGFILAMALAITAWAMNTDFIYGHASIVWPFCLSLAALDGHPSGGVGSLLVCMMGAMNGLYYAALALLTWKIVQLLPTKPCSDKS